MDSDKFERLGNETLALAEILAQRHTGTARHSSRVSVLCEDLAGLCGLNAEERQQIRIAGLFHDIGKVSIPDTVLLKPDALSSEEWEIMRRHSELGSKIINSSKRDGCAEVALVIHHHHERFDGTGYPAGLSGEDIPVCSRMISIIDSYDAMSEDRPYRPRMNHETIMGLLSEKVGEMYDPYLFRKFSACISAHPQRAPSTSM